MGSQVDGFTAFRQARDDRLFTLPEGWSTAPDSLIAVRRQTVRLTVLPERIVFREA